MPSLPLRRTPLYDRHTALGGRMTPFAGWEMPIQYPAGIVEETLAVRRRCGLFDVSHMGRIFVSGADAARLLRAVLTFNVNLLAVGQSHYTLLCTEDGGILDDPYLFRLGDERWMLVPNASRMETALATLISAVEQDWSVRIDDRQAQTVMLALQGPGAVHVFAAALSREIAERLPRRHHTEIELYGQKAVVSRTGYTGEDGFEVVCGVESGVHLWDTLINMGVAPAGLGARDTLRLEAALALYGQDIDESTNPYEAGLGWTVSLDDGAPFTGREALVALRDTPGRRLCCLQATARGGVIRRGFEVRDGDRVLGVTTSGGFSPTLGTSVALAYLPRADAAVGRELSVAVRGTLVPVRIVRRPFYRSPDA